MKYLTNKILFVFCFLLVAAVSFAASEAEYKKLAKSWTLNADGSQEFHYSMELTLFTHTAMNSTYGESFIVYNPAYQTLKINDSYTKQKNGNIVKTPDNAFVEVLPSAAANAPAYNGLKEMVVVHTGLELGATIYLDYTITTKAGYLPALDIYEPLKQTSPVKEYTLSVKLPESVELHSHFYQLYGKETVSTSGSQKTYTWTLRNVGAKSRLADAYHFDEPLFVANTYASTEAMAQTLSKQMDSSKSMQLLKTLAETITEKASTDAEKLKAIYGYIQNSYAHIPLDLNTCGYRIRPLEEVINSAYGTDAELMPIFQGLLKASGFKSDIYAAFTREDAKGMGLNHTFLFLTTENNGTNIILAPTETATRRAMALRQYCPALNLANGELAEPEVQSNRIAYNADITLEGETMTVRAESTVANCFLDVNGNTTRKITAGDKEAKTSASETSATFNYTHELKASKAGDYLLLHLPDYPFSATHENWASGSERDILLSLFAANDETYTYRIHLGGKTLCTPATDLKISNSAGSVEISVQPESDGATVKRSMKLSKSQFTPKEYPDYVKLMQAWGDMNHTQLLVK